MTYNIGTNTSTATINQEGSILSFECENCSILPPAYLVFFNEYSRINPFCELWDISDGIENVTTTPNSIKYSKTLNDIQTINLIELVDDGWNWEVSFLEEQIPMNVRFGISVPMGNGSEVQSIYSRSLHSISQYTMKYGTVYSDQTQLMLPILYVQSQPLTALFGSPNRNFQFFKYEDLNTQYVRSTCLSTDTSTIKLYFRALKSLYCLKKQYTEHFPKTKQQVYRWMPLLENLSQKHRIDITPISENRTFTKDNSTLVLSPIEEKDLLLYINVLSSELDKYPPGFFASFQLQGILLAGEMQMQGNGKISRLNGFALLRSDETVLSWLLYSNPVTKHVIHHEIFHLIEKRLDFKQAINTSKDTVFASQNATQTKREQLADLFASSMLNGIQCQEQLDIKEYIQKHYDDFEIPDTANVTQDLIWYQASDGNWDTMFFGDYPVGAIQYSARNPHA